MIFDIALAIGIGSILGWITVKFLDFLDRGRWR